MNITATYYFFPLDFSNYLSYTLLELALITFITLAGIEFSRYGYSQHHIYENDMITTQDFQVDLVNHSFLFQFYGNEVRGKMINDKEYFCASDVCKVLEYANGRKAVEDNCEKDGVTISDIIDKLGRTQEATFINEANLFRLLIKSRLPKAKEFEKLVFEKILPQIRKTGSYSASALPTNISADFLIEIANKMKMLEIENKQKEEIIEEQEQEIERKTKTINRFIGIDKEAIPSEAGKKLGLHPYKFVAKLKEYRYYVNDEPYQEYITRGYFVVKYTEPKLVKGEWRKYPRFFITPKGFEYFAKKLQEGLFDDIKVDIKKQNKVID